MDNNLHCYHFHQNLAHIQGEVEKGEGGILYHEDYVFHDHLHAGLENVPNLDPGPL